MECYVNSDICKIVVLVLTFLCVFASLVAIVVLEIRKTKL